MKPIIIGAGLAGLTVALSLAPRPVIVLSSRKLGDACASAWAQGGIAAAIGADDSAALHADDTIKAGGGLCDADIVRQVTRDGVDVIKTLIAQGVAFDRDAAGELQLGLEGAHKKRRVVHAADATGAAIMKAFVAAVRATPSIEVIEYVVAANLLTDQGAITGVAIERGGYRTVLTTDKVVLATGGAGALWRHTTNPLGSTGRGLALAARAGAELGDLEFMQFHPTAIDIGRDPMPLASEALRGEGCILIDDKGERFVDELQPRDIVARAIWQQTQTGHKVFLDARAALGEKFAARFPGIYAQCMSAGIDPVRAPIPVRPAAHYHMGGVVTDANGRTNVQGLWACGEVANTGLHGANRLASNSLLEAAVFGKRVVESMGDTLTAARCSPPPLGGGVRGGVYKEKAIDPPPAKTKDLLAPRSTRKSRFSLPPPQGGRGYTIPVETIRTLMSQHVGMVRDEAGLNVAIQHFRPLAMKSDMALVGLMIAVTALRREESRGAHTRSDFPETSPAFAYRQILTLADVMPSIEEISDTRFAVGA